MTRMKLANCFWVLPLLLVGVGCSGERLIDLGGTAGNGNSAGAAGAPSSGGTASSGSPDLPPTVKEMTVQLGATKYEYSCTDQSGQASGGRLGPGARLNAVARDGNCPWSHPKPALDLNVLFRGFLLSVGFAPGVYDLAEQVNQNVVVTFSAQNQGELRVGETAPYVVYSSSSTDPYISEPPTAPAVGVSGTVTVTKYGPVGGAGDDDFDCDLTLKDIVLPQLTNTGGDFPSTVTIESAHFLQRW
jgi:hypothetical protein